MKHRCQKCQRIFRVVDYHPGEAYVCDGCGGRLKTLVDKVDPRLIHNPEIQEFEPEKLLGLRAGTYRLLRLIGVGASAAVFQGEGPQGEAAVKILHPTLAADRRSVHRFVREARTIGRLDVPELLTLLDSGEVETRFGRLPYLAAEYAGGGTLADLIKDGPVEPMRAVRVIRDAGAGLAAAHKAGVIHRDVKPANILLTAEGRAKVSDFGLARVDGSLMLTSTRAVLGTPHYMSPEQIIDDNIDGRADVYGLGATLYHLITGRPPFRGRLLHVLRAHANEIPVPPSHRVGDLPIGLDAVVLRTLAKKPDERYKHMAEFVDDLDAILDGEDPPTAGTTGGYRRHKRAPAKVMLVALGAIGTARLAAAALLAVLWVVGLAVLEPDVGRAAVPLAIAAAFASIAALSVAVPPVWRIGRWPADLVAPALVALAATTVAVLLHRSLYACVAAAGPTLLVAVLLTHAALSFHLLRPPPEGVRAMVGHRLPDFHLVDHDGYPVRRKDLAEQPSFFVFLCSPRCHYCLLGAAGMVTTGDDLRMADVRLFAVGGTSVRENRALRRDLGLDFPILFDRDATLTRPMGISREDGPTLPFRLLVDGSSKIVWAEATDRRIPAPLPPEVLLRLDLVDTED